MDNFSKVDKSAGPNVSFIKRFHCSLIQSSGTSVRTYVCVTTDVYVRTLPVHVVMSYPVPQESDPFFIPFTLTDYGMNKVSVRGEARRGEAR